MSDALQNFRSKYPGYDDLSDQELASKLVAKHPEYNDILGNIASNGTAQIKTGNLTPSGGEQVAGPTISPHGLFNAIAPTKEQLPEIIGTTVGAMAGGIPGAILGGGAGEAYKQLGQRAGILKGQPPQTPSDAATGIAGGATRGGLSEAGGQLISKAFSPFAKAFTPEAAAAKAAAESAGIEIPLGNLTESKPLQVAERSLEYTPFGQAITRQRKIALEGLKNYTDTIAGKMAVDRPSEVTGNLAKQALAELPAKYDATTDALYDAVMPLIKKANPKVELTNTISTLDDILARRSGDLEPGGLKMLRDLRESLVPKASEVGRPNGTIIPAREAIVKEGIPGLAQPSEIVKESSPGKYIGGGGPGLTVATGVPGMAYPEPGGSIGIFEQLKRLRTNLGLRTKFNDPASVGLAEDMKQLYGAMSEDLSNTVKKVSQSAYDDLMAANAKYAEGKQLIGDSLFKAIASAKPENVYKLVIVPGSPSQAALGKEMLGDQFKDVTRQWFQDIVKKSTTPDGTLNPVLFSKWLKNYDTVIPEITAGNPALATEFQKLGQITNAMAGRGNQAIGGSQTAYAASTIGAVASTIFNLLTGDLKKAGIEAGMIGATGLGVAGIKSGVGRELLTQGYPRVGAAAGRATQIGGSIGLSKLIEDRLNK